MGGVNGSDALATVAVIGAGIMGSAMTRNLVAASVSTRVWDGSPAATAPLAAAGAVVAPRARMAVRDANVVITMLPTADAVESVIFDGGAADAFVDGCVWAQMGTIGVESTLRIRDRLAAQRPSVMFVDAPVSGSTAVGRALSPVARRRGRRARPPGHQRRPPGPGQRKPDKLAHRQPDRGRRNPVHTHRSLAR